MYFNDEITSVQLVLLIVGVFLMLLSVVAILFRTIPLKRYVKRAKQNILHLEGSLPAASVIIFAHDDSNSLAEMLPQVLSQNYTGDFEVIVVNDGKSPDVKDITEHFMLSHRNLYFTAAPDGARNLSRKKLALTLGIKAAKSPIVVHTTSAARVNSPQWLNNIMKHFAANPEVDVVIGFSSAPPYDDNGFGARARSFDAVADSIGWVVPAINGSAWRGTEHNLAYRRKAFFDNKGFSRHLNLRDGDDDIFVNEIVNRNNTIFELSPDTVVDVPGDNNSREMRERFARRRFTRRFIQNRTCFAGTIFAAAYFLALFDIFALLFVGPINKYIIFSFVILLVFWYAIGLLWNSAIRILNGRSLRFSTPIWAFTRPIRIFNRTLHSTFSRGKRYTWE